MPSLENAAKLAEGYLHRIDGMPFLASIQPLSERLVSGYAEPRFFMRVHINSTIQNRDVIQDTVKRKFIVGRYDTGLIESQPIYRSHLLFVVNKQVAWQRKTTGALDTLTGLEKNTGTKTNLGNIYVSIDVGRRETPDPAFKFEEEVRMVVSPVQLLIGDIVDSMVVKRVYQAFDLWVAELE